MTDRLEQLLIASEGIGEVTLHKMDVGWWATIKLPAPVGCEAKVKSDVGCKTPTLAVEQMFDRLCALKKGLSIPLPLLEG